MNKLIDDTIERFHLLSVGELRKHVPGVPLDLLTKIRDKLDDLYYNTGTSIFSDEKYDVIKEYLGGKKVGAKLREDDNRATLPFWLGSADKVTPNDGRVFDRWVSKMKGHSGSGEYVVSAKLDGVSCLLVVEPGKIAKGDNKPLKNGKLSLYTRGDGVVGADISYLAGYFNLPKIPLLKKQIAIRGELIIKKQVFKHKYEGIYRNPRNMVSGLIGGKTSREGLHDVNFVVYEMISNETADAPEKQLQTLSERGFKVVEYKKFGGIELTLENLQSYLLQLKVEYEYEVDGVIIQPNVRYDRNTEGNPDYLLAFKINLEENIFQTMVRSVEWNASRQGQLKPVVIVDPVETGGITISRATAHNAKFIVENKIGPGTIIRVTRSKDVIPFIVDVVTSTTPSLPPLSSYNWDATRTNILAKGDEYSSDICKKIIANFFEVLEVKYLGYETVSKLYDNGLDTVMKIIKADETRFVKVPSIQHRTAERIYTGIHQALHNVQLYKLLTASGIFGTGIGEKKIQLLLQHIPDLVEENGGDVSSGPKYKNVTIGHILSIEGFSTIMATRVMNNLPGARLFIRKIKKYAKIVESIRENDSLLGKIFVFSGFRDSDLTEKIQTKGGSTSDSVSSKTTCVVVAKKSLSTETSKVTKARSVGVPIYDKEEFIRIFELG